MATGAEKPSTLDSRKASEEDILLGEEEEEGGYFGGCCGLWCFRGRSRSLNYENASLLYGATDQQQQMREGWWVQKGKSVKQFSEILAGPKWKTFMRRFNHQSNNSKRKSKPDFRYDPQSYALNFDCGGEFDEDGDYPDFSGRFAASHLKNGSVHQFGS